MNPSSIIPPQLNTLPCFLCKDCEAILTQPWARDGLVHHKPNFYTLQSSAMQGCGLCRYFCDSTTRALDEHAFDAHATVRETLALGSQGEPCVMFLHRVCPVEPLFRGWIDELQYVPRVRPYKEGRFVQGDFGSSKFMTRVSLLAGKNECIGGRVVPTYPDLKRCRAWIDQCQTNHRDCRKTATEEQQLPTRLIDVGLTDEHASIRLVVPGHEKGRYVALSHRWGDPPPPATTASNFHQHLEGIPFETLPQMFKDAVLITRKLGYRHLWIDSLCILQGDKQDWRREYPQMTSVYRNAAVTLAGPGCERSTDGLLRPREASSVTRTLRVKSNDSAIDCVLQLDGCNMRKFEDYPGPSYLSNRAWALQERLLSPRVLYFGPHQMYFECNSSGACEGVIDTPYPLWIRGIVAAKNTLDLPIAELYESWEGLVEDYSERFLTFESDRLPGIAGLAKFLQQRLKDEYRAGLWRNDFVSGLLWQRASREPRCTDAVVVCGPSWSWVSCNYRISYSRLYNARPGFDIGISSRAYSSPGHIQLIDLSLDPADTDVSGQITQGRMKIKCKLKDVYIGRVTRRLYQLAVYSTDPDRDRIGVAIMDHINLGDQSNDNHSHIVQRQDHYPVEDSASATKAVCVLISSGTQWYSHDDHTRGWIGVWVGLVLENVAKDSEDTVTFRRIGLAYGYRLYRTADGTKIPEELASPAAYFDDARIATIDVV